MKQTLQLPPEAPELFVANFHPRFTGVSATANAVVARQQRDLGLRLVGRPLPLAGKAISYAQALRFSRRPPERRPFAIWHVRRNLEMAAALFARDVLRLPVRIVFTSAAQRRHSVWPRQLIARMDAVIATTAKAASFVPHVATVAPHGVDVERFQPAADRAAAWAATGYGGKYGIGIVGRVRPEKGTDLFVEALCRLLPERPDFTALVIGRAMPPDREFALQLQQRLAAAGLAERVHFVGEIAADEMPSLMRSLSLLAAPARYEGFGMTPLEAMASGVAVVAVDTGAYSTMIVPGETGSLATLGDAQSLADAMLEITADPDELHRCGARGRERAETHFSLEGEVRAIAQVYERLWRGERFD